MREERYGDWIQTFTGQRFWPLDPFPAEVDLLDIAHALSNLCRFAGHCRSFYSVAQHSVHVSEICDPADALRGLLHDAAEAYVCDLPRPIKRAPLLRAYGEIEDRITTAISLHFDLPGMLPASVKRADEIMLATEGRDLMSLVGGTWALSARPHPALRVTAPWTPDEARERFLARFAELQR